MDICHSTGITAIGMQLKKDGEIPKTPLTSLTLDLMIPTHMYVMSFAKIIQVGLVMTHQIYHLQVVDILWTKLEI